MGKDCRLSCDKCHVVRLNSADEIGKFLASKKGEIDAMAKEQEALKALKQLEDGAEAKDDEKKEGKDEL